RSPFRPSALHLNSALCPVIPQHRTPAHHRVIPTPRHRGTALRRDIHWLPGTDPLRDMALLPDTALHRDMALLVTALLDTALHPGTGPRPGTPRLPGTGPHPATAPFSTRSCTCRWHRGGSDWWRSLSTEPSWAWCTSSSRPSSPRWQIRRTRR